MKRAQRIRSDWTKNMGYGRFRVVATELSGGIWEVRLLEKNEQLSRWLSQGEPCAHALFGYTCDKVIGGSFGYAFCEGWSISA